MKIKKFNFKKTKTNILKKFYNEEGYIVIRNIFSESDTIKLNKSISFFADDDWHNIMNPDRIEFLMSQNYSRFSKLKTLNERINFFEKAQKTSKLFRSYLTSNKIQSILHKLTNKKFVGLMSHVIFKKHNTKFSKQAWNMHQDNSYAKMEKGCFVTTNLFIHKATKKNGCLFLLPGSHKNGLFKFKKWTSYHAKKNQKPGNIIQKNLNDYKRIDLIVKAGDFLIMNGDLIHGSYPNLSKKYSRHLLSFNYGVKGKKFSPGFTAKRKEIYFNT